MRRALLVLAISCGGPQLAEPGKRADLSRLLPATLEAERPKSGDPRVARVHVWADAGVRALPHWREDIADQIDYASQLLTPFVGIRLQVDKVGEWDRQGDPKLALDELRKADAGDDATWVIGYVTPPDASTKDMAELGEAHVLDKHIIVRSWPEQAETTALAGRLPELKDADRAEVIAAHKRHKQTVVLLHMLAATVGAIGEADPSWIQALLYSPKQSTFSQRNRELIELGIGLRLAVVNQQTLAHDLLENIEKQDWGGWVPADKDQVVTALRNAIDSSKAGKTAADVPSGAYQQFDRVRELQKKGDIQEATLEIDNLLSAYPGNAAMTELKCELLIAKPGLSDKVTLATCAHASEVAPGDPTPHMVLGEAYAKAKDLATARTQLAQAEDLIANLKTGQADAWRRVIGDYVAIGALTWTEDAIAKAKLDHDPAAPIVAQTRVRFGLSRDGKIVKPEAEGAFVAAIQAALDQIYASKYSDATRALAAAERKWPGAPGVSAARCDLELRQGHAAEARSACQRAIASDPNDSWALYLSGVLDLKNESGTKAGIEQLKRAIAVDPDLGQAWRALGKAYAREHATAELERLGKDYAAKFNQQLPQ